MENWYHLQNEAEIDSPAVVVYYERMEQNLRKAIEWVGNSDRLRPHVKTHKTLKIIELHLQYGIKKFKCATIAEAEMVAIAGGEDVLLAHQLTPPKLPRWFDLLKKYPNTHFSTIVDNDTTLAQIVEIAQTRQQTATLFLDLNNGMNRSGIRPNAAATALYTKIIQTPFLQLGGIHIYDGHIMDIDLEERKSHAQNDWQSVENWVQSLENQGFSVPKMVIGGSPAFPVHASQPRPNDELSPGTYIFWDAGYGNAYPDIPFLPAALIVTRVISKLDEHTVCVDLGHKAIASENPHPRVYFLNCRVEKFLTHSEEHLVFSTPDTLQVGDVLYGVPHHVCPTINLQTELAVAKNQKVTEFWEVIARRRKITV